MLKLEHEFKESYEDQNLDLETIIQESQKIVFPSWPLQNTVAVNPFWFYRNQDFEVSLAKLTQIFQENLMLPLSAYLEKVDSGKLSQTSLKEALLMGGKKYPQIPTQLEDFLDKCRLGTETLPKQILTFAQYLELQQFKHSQWGTFIASEVSKWLASYFDDRQAVSHQPDKTANFWEAWMKGQFYDSSMELKGASQFRKRTQPFKTLNSVEAISQIVKSLRPFQKDIIIKYFEGLLASVLGWSTVFKYLEWQKNLGYDVARNTSLNDLLAVLLVYDHILLEIAKEEKPSLVLDWFDKLRGASDQNPAFIPEWHFKYVFQLASELEYQRLVAVNLNKVTSRSKQKPKAQVVFCIDVRSEMIRRHVEREDSEIQTLGFAGFFGIPVFFQNPDTQEGESRLPVLLKPSFRAKEVTSTKDKLLANPNRVDESYFRNLRKNSLSSFAYVEFFGASYIFEMLRKTNNQIFSNPNQINIPHEWKAHENREIEIQSFLERQKVSLADCVDRAAQILKHMGLIEQFSDLVLIVGHGSSTTNNAFSSALACGACGGHAGDFNAILLTRLLNDPQIRNGLEIHSISIPKETTFIPAIHETVTDEIHILDFEKIPLKMQSKLKDLIPTLKRSSENTRKERLVARSKILDLNAKRRTQNWSEIRPEWGLAGNACFIVAPRSRTLGVDLNSRAFLHDYDWKKDEKSNYQTLELIMTAPMIVTNWINLQYYASTVAPHIYSSGNKLIHNLVNEMGVVEGNGGDLRVGLPLQSVYDGSQFIHEPLRLSVFIEAPLEKIEEIIHKHITVRELIEHEWLHLIHIDPMSLAPKRRLADGNYMKVIETSQ